MMRFRILKILTFLLPLYLNAYVYIFTDMGDVFRSQDGENYSLVSNTGFNDNISLLFISETQGYMLTRNGIILKTQDRAESWQVISSIPAGDAVDFLNAAGNFYVLTASGDVYKGPSINALTLSSSISGTGFVSLAFDGTYLYALGSSGDVWREPTNGSWNLVGSTGSMDMAGIGVHGDTLFAVNYYGDVFRSMNNGVTWQMCATVSQMGVVDIMVTEDGLVLIVFDTGEVMEETSKGWQYLGTVSQVGVKGIAASGVPTVIGDTIPGMRRFMVYPVVTSRYLRVESGEGMVEIYSIDGRLERSLFKRSGEIEIDIGNLASGVHFVRMGQDVVRIVKF